MLEPTYRQAVAHAWRLVWHNKLVWILGLLSVLVGQFGLNNFLGSFLVLSAQDFSLSALIPEGFTGLLTAGNTLWLIWLGVVVLALGIFFAFLGIAAQGSLISLSSSLVQGKKSLTLQGAWEKGVQHFWRLIAVKLIEKVCLGVLLVVVAYTLHYFLRLENVAGQFAMLVVVASAFFMALVTAVVAIYTACYVVVDELTVAEAFSRGWSLFRHHVLVSLELSLVVLFLNVIMVVALAYGSVWLLFPSAVFALLGTMFNSTMLLTFGIALSWFLFVGGAAIIGGLYNAFITTSWVYLFMRMHREGVVSRILHWFGLAAAPKPARRVRL